MRQRSFNARSGRTNYCGMELEHLHDGVGKSTLRKGLSAFHEEHHLVGVDEILNAIAGGFGHGKELLFRDFGWGLGAQGKGMNRPAHRRTKSGVDQAMALDAG